LVTTFAYNEGERIRRLVRSFPAERDYDLLLVDDGSTVGSTDGLEEPGVTRLVNERRLGLGAAIKRAFRYAIEQGYDALVIMAGNGKDDPAEVDRLLEPIRSGRADFVQGSRYLAGGTHENMPRYRILATRYVHPLLFSLAVGRRVRESTNGFRAMKVEILRDPRVDWEQRWLDTYALEQYVYFKAIRCGYRVVEVPVTKRYPADRRAGYTKIRPLVGWWSMLKPVVYLGLRVKR
jgi:dolichol-phosphate mannosyltransferase